MAISIFEVQSRRRICGLSSLFVMTMLLSVSSGIYAQDRLTARASDLPDAVHATPSNLPPSPPLSPEDAGDIQMARRAYQAAIHEFLQVSPKTARVWNKIGISYQQMFVTDQARKSYEAALKLEPRNTNVINNLGTIYYSLKQYKDAEQMYRKALKYGQKSALIYKNLGTAFLAEDKFKKGWDCYHEALILDPDIFERNNQLRIGEPTPVQKRGAMNYFLAKSYVSLGMPDRAVGYLRMALDEGFTDRKKLLADKEFASLHEMSAFKELIAEQSVQ